MSSWILFSQWRHPMHPMHDWGGGGGVLHMLMPLTFVIFFVAVIGLLFWFVSRQSTSHPGSFHPSARSSKSPLDILKERYARGEITKEEFDRIKEDLR